LPEARDEALLIGSKVRLTRHPFPSGNAGSDARRAGSPGIFIGLLASSLVLLERLRQHDELPDDIA
jgi:hypothetical protein